MKGAKPTRKCTFVVYYKETKRGPRKSGIAVGNDTGDVDVIVNSDGKVVKKIWDYDAALSLGFIWYDLKGDFFKGRPAG